MVLRFALLVAALVIQTANGQSRISSGPAKIILILPANIPSENVQMSYFMTGAFGGYGSFVRAEKVRDSYDIDASVEGKQATNIKFIVYLSGCEIVTLDIPVVEANLSRSLPCRKLATQPVHSRVSPALLIQEDGAAEIKVEYLAMWDHRFFGITDGPVTSFQVATAIPNSSGEFEASLPDFGHQRDLGKGEFQWTLRNTKTGNLIAFLTPSVDGLVLSKGQ